MPLVGLQCVIVVFPDHTHLLSDARKPLDFNLLKISPDFLIDKNSHI